jgi:hypothetical protein
MRERTLQASSYLYYLQFAQLSACLSGTCRRSRCCCCCCCCRLVDDDELAYVITRAREVHDFWHVLFDCHTNVFGELALKALEFVQVRLSGELAGLSSALCTMQKCIAHAAIPVHGMRISLRLSVE